MKVLTNLECPKCESKDLLIEDVICCPRVTCNNCGARYAITLVNLDEDPKGE